MHHAQLILVLGVAGWGAVVGAVVGFTAIGKGLLGTPGLIVLFGMDPVLAVGTMAVAGVAMMFAGSVTHARGGNVEWRIAVLFSLTAMPGSYLAARFAREINDVVPLKTVIAVAIVFSVVLLFYRYVIMRAPARALEVKRAHLFLAPITGIVLGVLLGATSISGSIIVIAFILLLKLPSPHAVGTTSVVSAVSLAVASVAHLQQGNVDPLVLAGLLPGVLVGSIIGARYVNRVPRQALRIGILAILLAAAVMIVVD
ncbi:MAG: sulfite exporter TauE/SafE family protein [Spirochaetaceae bacterium]|nr:MAG: sulfite exporter TauE/SafE family protein [Spirochaetaceae bacterium]